MKRKRWSKKYKRSIDCNNPKGFSQKQYCKRKKRGGKYKKSRTDILYYIYKLSSNDVVKERSSLLYDILKKASSTSAFMHVTAPSGCGKTTLMNKLEKIYPEYNFIDLDELSDIASENLNLPINWQVKEWSKKRDEEHLKEVNRVVFNFIKDSEKPVVFFGIHHSQEGGMVGSAMEIPAEHKIFLDVGSEICAERKLNRELPKAKVQADGSILGDSFVMKADWMTSDMNLDDEEVVGKIKEDLKEEYFNFKNQVISLGYKSLSLDELLNMLKKEKNL